MKRFFDLCEKFGFESGTNCLSVSMISGNVMPTTLQTHFTDNEIVISKSTKHVQRKGTDRASALELE